MANKLELMWYGKDDSFSVEPRLLIEDKLKSNIDSDTETENMIIHGDNLLALKALEKKYAGKVKCIYIDPPYNTGAAFDYYDDNLEHSTWLSLMSARLKILRGLLSDDGFLCCQIDDSEGAYLKVLLDEIFGRSNYLNTFYIQVRYPNKTLAEDSDYQKVIEQCHVYAKQKSLAKLNRPQVEYGIDKFKWKIVEDEPGEIVTLGNKKVEIFKPNQYHIQEIEPCYEGLKETWATGSLARVKASAGEFFELYLAERKEVDGLGCLYKVEGIGEDGLGYRYISGPKKATAKKGKFYSGIPLKRLEELKSGKSMKYVPVSNFCDFAGNFGNCRLEGDVDFKGGKKPEPLIQMILNYYSNPGDLVLDSFLGSGTTAAVAHKMGRKYIGIEMGDHAYSHCKHRIDRIISGEDKGGISKEVNWQGGGGYRFYELAPTLVTKDDFDEDIINPEYDSNMLASAVALHEGFTYSPDADVFWKQAQGTESSYLFVTTRHINRAYLDAIHDSMNEGEFLIIACRSYNADLEKVYGNITIKKIPQMLLDKCEFNKDNYDLNIINPPVYDDYDEEDDCDE